MTGLLDMYFPAEDPMSPAALFPQGLLGPSVLSRMQQHSDAQRARMASGDYSPSRMDEDAMWLADDLAGGLLGTLPGGLMVLGAGHILGGRGRIIGSGPRSARAFVGDAYAGEVNLAERGPFISSIIVEPEFRGQGIGRELYKEAEELAKTRLIPSPLGLSDDATRIWRQRLSEMPPDAARALIEQSREIGRGYGISDAHLSERLDGLISATPVAEPAP